MPNPTPSTITREQLANAVLAKVAFMAWPPTDDELAEMIEREGLTSVIVPGTRPPKTFGQCYQVVFNKKTLASGEFR